MISNEVAEKIATAVEDVNATTSLGGRYIAANIDTGELGGETFSEGARPPLGHPWYLVKIRPTSAESILEMFGRGEGPASYTSSLKA